MTPPTDPQELNRRKQTRRNAKLNLAAHRMGFPSWSTFGKAFVTAINDLPNATEQQINAAIKRILADALKAIPKGADEPDAELERITQAIPRLRKW